MSVYPKVKLKYKGTLTAPSPFTGKVTGVRIDFGLFTPRNINLVDIRDAPEMLTRVVKNKRVFSLLPSDDDVPQENVDSVLDALKGKAFDKEFVYDAVFEPVKKPEEPKEPEEDLTSLPVKSSAQARKKAEELGVDINKVTGTGNGGGITVEDVKSHAKNK